MPWMKRSMSEFGGIAGCSSALKIQRSVLGRLSGALIGTLVDCNGVPALGAVLWTGAATFGSVVVNIGGGTRGGTKIFLSFTVFTGDCGATFATPPIVISTL